MQADAWAQLLARPGTDARLVALAARTAELPEWSLPALEAATRALAGELGLKAGDVIAPARIALTGRTAAPGIFEVMWLLGRDRVVRRLNAAVDRWRAESPLAAGA